MAQLGLERLWLEIVGVTLAFILGHYGCASANSVQPNEFLLLPLLVELLVGPVWAIAAIHIKSNPPAEDLPKDPVVAVGSIRYGQKNDGNRTYYEREKDGAPVILLSECTTTVVDPKTDRRIHLPRIRAVTAKAFIEKGWPEKFSSKMIGMSLEDGLGTECKRGLWTKMTDALNSCHLITKIPQVGSTMTLSSRSMLRFIEPTPMPAGWRGWFRDLRQS